MPDPSTTGSFTPGVAQLIQPGAVEYDDNDVPQSVTDVWGVVLDYGTRPVLGGISGLPAAGSAHPSYPYLLRGGLSIRNAVEMAGSRVWLIDVAYAPQGSAGSVNNPSSDPDQPVASAVRILEKAWPIYEVEADLVADAKTGETLLNAAGEPYDRVPQIKRRYMGARVKRAEQNWPSLAASLDGTLNAAAVTVLGVAFAARCARLEIEIEDTLAVGSDSRYHVTYNIVPAHTPYGANLDAGFDAPIVEQGFSYLSDGELVRATVPDDAGNSTPTPLPVLLAADGSLLPAGSDPVVHVWATYPDASWAGLNLPTTPLDGDPPAPEPDPPDPDPAP